MTVVGLVASAPTTPRYQDAGLAGLAGKRESEPQAVMKSPCWRCPTRQENATRGLLVLGVSGSHSVRHRPVSATYTCILLLLLFSNSTASIPKIQFSNSLFPADLEMLARLIRSDRHRAAHRRSSTVTVTDGRCRLTLPCCVAGPGLQRVAVVSFWGVWGTRHSNPLSHVTARLTSH